MRAILTLRTAGLLLRDGRLGQRVRPVRPGVLLLGYQPDGGAPDRGGCRIWAVSEGALVREGHGENITPSNSHGSEKPES